VSVKGLRQAIAQNINTITGLHTAFRVPETIASPPLAVVMPPSIEYDKSFGRGLDQYEMKVIVFVGRFDSKSAEDLLDGYANGIGSTSIKRAIESTPMLTSNAFDLRVTSMREVGPVVVGDLTYLAATFIVVAMAI